MYDVIHTAVEHGPEAVVAMLSLSLILSMLRDAHGVVKGIL
jgi:hypothetical protein